MSDKIIGWNYEGWMICPRCNQKYGKSNLAFQDMPIYYGCGCMPKDKMYFIDTKKMELKATIENFTVTEPMKPGIYKKQELLPILAMAALAFVAVIALFCAVTAKAERLINLNLVVVEHPDSPTPETQIRLFNEGISRLTELGIKPRLLRIDVVPDLYNANTLNDVYSRLYTWIQYQKKERFKGIVFYSLPPMTADFKLYTAGQAGALCVFSRNKRKKFAEGSMKDFNSTGQDRQPQARVVVLHEILHLLGANHIDSKGFDQLPNVMHPAAQAYATIPNLPILNLTKRQVRWCKQGKNVLGKRL